MSDLNELYQETILEHNKNPRNFRSIEDADQEADGNNPLCGDALRVYVKMDGDTVAEAADGIQALDAVDRHAPDVILLDLNLPGLDGYSVLQQLRSRASTSRIPVIVLTAKGDEDNEVRVFQLGADDFLTKPVRARALAARLEAVLSRRRA